MPMFFDMHAQKNILCEWYSYLEIVILVCCIIDISPNNLYKFPSAALSSIAVARYDSFLRLAERKFILRYLAESQ